MRGWAFRVKAPNGTWVEVGRSTQHSIRVRAGRSDGAAMSCWTLSAAGARELRRALSRAIRESEAP